MHATLRRIKTQPGRAAEVARLIEAEYLPQIEGVDGFISYTLIDLGERRNFQPWHLHQRGKRSTGQCRRAHLDLGNPGTIRGVSAGRARRVGADPPQFGLTHVRAVGRTRRRCSASGSVNAD